MFDLLFQSNLFPNTILNFLIQRILSHRQVAITIIAKNPKKHERKTKLGKHT